MTSIEFLLSFIGGCLFIGVANAIVTIIKEAYEKPSKSEVRKNSYELYIRLEALFDQYEATAGLDGSYNGYRSEVVKSLKASGVIPKDKIYVFEHTKPPCHLLKTELRELLAMCRW